MALLSAYRSGSLAGVNDYHDLYSSDFRTRPDAPASAYPSPFLLASNINSRVFRSSQLDLLQQLVTERLSQLAEQIERHAAMLSPGPADVLALRDTSPSSETATPPFEAGPASKNTSDYTYSVYNMPRRSTGSPSTSPSVESSLRRTRRTSQLESVATGRPPAFSSSAPSVVSPTIQDKESISGASTNSSPLSSPPLSPDGNDSSTKMLRKSVSSQVDFNPHIQELGSRAGEKRRKVSRGGDDGKTLLVDETYYLRHPNVEDQFKQIAEAAKGMSDSWKRTRRNAHVTLASRVEVKAAQCGLATSSNNATTTRKRKAYAISNMTSQGPSHLQKATPNMRTERPSSTHGGYSEQSTEVVEGRSARLLLPRGLATEDLRSKSNSIPGLLDHEQDSKSNSSNEHDSAWLRSKDCWSGYQNAGNIYSGADSEPTYLPDSEAKGSPARSNRGGGRGVRGRGGAKGNGSRGGGNGNGGRGRPRGKKGPGDEDPEPPRKRQLTEEEEEQIKRLKQRQHELKKLFSTVGAHHADLLDQLAMRDLNKLVKKARAHTKVPEYDEVREHLEQRIEGRQDLAGKRFEIAKEAEMKRYAREEELIETQYRRRCENTRIEHLQGLQGDMVSLKKAHATALDETRTETGSDIDYFPRYHELPEPDTHVRGYTSSKITDEKPFKEYLESRGDVDLQDVINEDITGPMIESIQKENAKHAEEQRVQDTQTMEALSSEAAKRIEDIRSSPKIGLMRHVENDSRKLSALAEMSELMAKQQLQQQYFYMPQFGEQLRQNTMSFGPHVGQANGRPLAPAPTSMLQQSIPVMTVPTKRLRNKSKASVSSISSISSMPHMRPSLSVQTQAQTNGTTHPHATSIAQSPIVSSGPGQPIAPAPRKPLPPFSATTPIRHPGSSPFRRPSEPASQRYQGYALGPPVSMSPQTYGPPPPPPMHNSQPGSVPASPRMMPSPRTPRPSGGPQFVFQQPSGMPSSPRLNYGPHSPVGGPQGGTQGKIPVTFVNQTIASRKAAAVAKANRRNAADQGNDSGTDGKASSSAGERRGSIGQRMLLPRQ